MSTKILGPDNRDHLPEYIDGLDAAYAGEDIDNCPPLRVRLREAWKRGWFAGRRIVSDMETRRRAHSWLWKRIADGRVISNHPTRDEAMRDPPRMPGAFMLHERIFGQDYYRGEVVINSKDGDG